MKSNNDYYKSIYITLKISAELNQLLTESAKRSNRKKIPEATLRLEDHLKLYRSMAEPNKRTHHHTEDSDVYSPHS